LPTSKPKLNVRSMIDPIGTAQLGLTLIEKAWRVIGDVRGAGENIDNLKAELETLKSVLGFAKKDLKLNPAEADFLDVSIRRCNRVIEDITKRLEPFSNSKGRSVLGFRQSVEAAWGKSGFDKSLIDLRRAIELLMGARGMLKSVKFNPFHVTYKT